MRHLDLFSGIGGFALGLGRAGFNTVAFCEIEPYAQRVLAEHWLTVPIFQDIHTLNPENLKEAIGDTTVDILTGGYPCQPFSTAGKRGGAGDDRHLWPEIARLIRQMDAAGGKPRWCLFENVAGHITLGLDTVLSDLEGLGYTCWPLVIPACAVGASHRRDRVWILANTMPGRGAMGWNSSRMRRESEQIKEHKIRQIKMESCFCRNFDGISAPMDRLRGLGNAVVPQIVEVLGRAIMEAEHARQNQTP